MIRDNGVGMNETALQIANEPSDHDNNQTMGAGGEAAVQDERRGLGLHNVADRLRIHYGSSYGLRICSQEGYGTVIRIHIPRSRG